ncbi:hypothetical protein Zm00014a_038265 [Zea mays]|uniref:DUF4220 domain-containing protein n=1 Tax=Zea mays TaxID=4577 RepID=A0A3L6DW49_MAIZE|nr:hypothetical protein Zm00014a_038265 [Zea mays]
MLAAAVLLLLQVFFGFYRRRWWRSSFLSTALRASSKIMEALIIYTLGTMQSSPIKNLSYPVWAVFLVMASAGTTAVQHYEFCDSFNSKYMEGIVDMAKYGFYMTMFNLLIDPNTYTFKAALDLQRRHVKNPRASSRCVAALFSLALSTKALESCGLAFLGYTKQKSGLFISNKFRRRTQAAETTEGTAADNGTSDDDSDPQSMKGYEYAVCYRVFAGGQITVDQIWDRLDGNSASLKDLCLSYALFVELKNRCFFGRVRPKTSSATTKDHDFVFKKLLPSEGDFRRAFRIIEAELGFCYDFFFTKYYYTFIATNLPPVPFLQFLVLAKTVLIFIVGVFAVRNSLVLETPNPIIEVQISRADYIISLLLLVVALVVELVHVAFYLASDWAQLRRNRMKQYSVIEQRQEDPVEVSDAVKRAVARSLISTYGGNNPTNDDAAAVETWQWQDQMPFRRLDSTTNFYDEMKELQGTGEEDDPRKIFQKGIKLGKQLGTMADGDHWEVLQDFWAKTTIHAAKSHYTTKQHMQHLESGGEFLTHIWALLAHAGILNLNVGNEDQEDKANLGSGPSAVV